MRIDNACESAERHAIKLCQVTYHRWCQVINSSVKGRCLRPFTRMRPSISCALGCRSGSKSFSLMREVSQIVRSSKS